MLGLKSKSFKTFGKKVAGYAAFGLKNAGRLGQFSGTAVGAISPLLLAGPDPIGKGLGFIGAKGGATALYAGGTALRLAGSCLEKLSA